MPSKFARPLGILLVVVGLAGFAWGGVSWINDSETFEAGPMELTVREKESVPIHPALAGLLLAAGAAVLFLDHRGRPA